MNAVVGAVIDWMYYFVNSVHFVIPKNDENIEQLICIKVCFKLEKSYTESIKIMKKKTVGNDYMANS